MAGFIVKEKNKEYDLVDVTNYWRGESHEYFNKNESH